MRRERQWEGVKSLVSGEGVGSKEGGEWEGWNKEGGKEEVNGEGKAGGMDMTGQNSGKRGGVGGGG